MQVVEFKGLFETKEPSTKDSYRYEYEKDYKPEEVQVAYLKINNKIYRFEEDPSDGYRSYCEYKIVPKAPEDAVFNFDHYPVLVCMVELEQGLVGDPDNNYGPFDLKDFRGIVIISPKDKQTVLGVFGTDNIGDYYPGCRMYMDIEAINKHCIPNTEAGKLIYAPEEID